MIDLELARIAQVVGGEQRNLPLRARVIVYPLTLRSVSPNTLFVALKGQGTDGHRFLAQAFRNGAASAIVSLATIAELSIDPTWPLMVVDSPLRSLQVLAKWYRTQLIDQVIAVTGSNGKTIVKDALGALLDGLGVATSPGSYNSHVGLPLAVLSIMRRAPLVVLEAGVSEPGDMAVLEEIASPDYGILTGVGKAHLASFGSHRAIAQEKMGLFRRIPHSGWALLPWGDEVVTELAASLAATCIGLAATISHLHLPLLLQ